MRDRDREQELRKHPLLLFVVFLYGSVIVAMVAAEFERVFP